VFIFKRDIIRRRTFARKGVSDGWNLLHCRI